MREDIRRLLEVQRVDDMISDEKEDQESLSENLAGNRRAVERARKRLEEAVEELRELRKSVDRRTLEVKHLEAQVEKDQGMLNQLTSNKDYKTMLSQIEREKADLSVLEDGVLEAMTKVDQKLEENKQIEAALKETEAALAAKEADVAAQAAVSRNRMAELDADRNSIVSQVDPELLDRYAKLYSHVDGRVVVPTLGRTCGGCNITLRAQTVSELMSENEIVCCTSCGRILFLDDDRREA